MASDGTMARRRVVVTGIGAVTPLGLNAEETWQNALEGKSGVGPITLFDASECSVRIAGEVKGYEPTGPTGPFHPKAGLEVNQICAPKEVKKMGRFIHLSLGACFEAYGNSGLDECRKDFSPTRFGVNIGVGMGGLPEIEKTHGYYVDRGYRKISPFFIPEVIANLASGQISVLLDLQGPNICNVTACSSSAHALGESFRMIERGDADVMLAGGAEAVIGPLAVGGFANMRALAARNEEPTLASRPFDVERSGFVIAEGAASVILEEYEFARKRGAKILGEILGYGLSGDAYHMTLPPPGAAGGYRAMEAALNYSGLSPEDVHYINAHGTSTPAGDVEEARAIAKLFPDAKSHLHVSSTKSMTGHMLGAAGAAEAVFCLQALRDGAIPPTINLDTLDPECEKLGLDFTANRSIRKEIQVALTNSFGFGGTNASLILGKASS